MLQAGEASAAPALAGAALDKLKQAHELIMRAGDSRQTRLAYQLGALMAREQLVAQDPASARRLLQSVAGTAVGQCAGALYMCFACCAHRHPILCVCGAQTALQFVWTLSYYSVWAVLLRQNLFCDIKDAVCFGARMQPM